MTDVLNNAFLHVVSSRLGPGLALRRFGEFLSWWAAIVASYCPSRVVEHPKLKSTQPRSET